MYPRLVIEHAALEMCFAYVDESLCQYSYELSCYSLRLFDESRDDFPAEQLVN